MTWVGPETITSLIEAHGTARGTMLRPAWQGEPGWPVLVPLVHLDALRVDRAGPDAARRHRRPRRRRPGARRRGGRSRASSTTSTRPVRDLPAYEGPPDPPAGHTHEWGADVISEAGLPNPDG